MAVAALLLAVNIALHAAAAPQAPPIRVVVTAGEAEFRVAAAANVTLSVGSHVYGAAPVNGTATVRVPLKPGSYAATLRLGGSEWKLVFYVPARLGAGYESVLVPSGASYYVVLVRAAGPALYEGGLLRAANITGIVLPRPVPRGVRLVLWGPRGPLAYRVDGVNLTLAEPAPWLYLRLPRHWRRAALRVEGGAVWAGGKKLFTANSTLEAWLAWGEVPGAKGCLLVWVRSKGRPGFTLALRRLGGAAWASVTWRGGAEARGAWLLVRDGGLLDLDGEENGVVEALVGVAGHRGAAPASRWGRGGPRVYTPRAEGRVLLVGRGWARAARGAVAVPGPFLVDNGSVKKAVGRVVGAVRGRALVEVEKEDVLTRFEVTLPGGVVVYNVTRRNGSAVEYWFQNGSRLVFYDDPNRFYVVWYSVPPWWSPEWHYRVPVVIEAGTPNMTVTRVKVNLTLLLSLLNVTGTPDNNSVRVVDNLGRLVPQQFYNASTGELWFVTDTAAAADTRYYVYFDILENGAKPPLDTFDLNLGFESGTLGWAYGKAYTTDGQATVVDSCTQGSTVTVSDSTTSQTVTVDNTAHSGCNWTLLGFRDYEEDGSSGVHEETWVSRVFGVPPGGGNFTFWFRIQGWDSKYPGSDRYDYMRILVNGSDIPYTTLLWVSNTSNLVVDSYGVGREYSYSNNVYQDLGWRLATFSLSSYAGSVVNVTIVMRQYSDNLYKTWLGVDDAELPVYNASLNYSLVEAFGVEAGLHPGSRPVNVAGYESLVTAKADAAASEVTAQLYDACGRLLANVTLYDDGTHGDPVAGDQNYSLLLTLPQGCPGSWSIVVEARDNSTSILSPQFDGLAHMPGQCTGYSESCFFNVGNWSGTVSVEVYGSVREDLGVPGVNDSDPGVPGARVGLFNDTDGDGALGPGDTLLAETSTGTGGAYSFLINSTNRGVLYFVAVDSRTVNTTRGLNPGYTAGDVWAEETWQSLWNGSAWAAGPMFGGRDPAAPDDWGDGVYEHYAAVNATLYWGGPVDFGFSFDVVVNVNPGGQGSLARFLNNSAAIAGPDEMRFVPMVPPNRGDAHGRWWRVELRGPVPQLDSGTVVDGRALWPNMTVRDENPGYMLAGSYSSGAQSLPVGTGPDGVPGTGDEPLLTGFPRPELEVDLWGHNLTVAEGASDVAIERVALFNGTGRGSAYSGYSAVYVPPATGPVTLGDVYLGLQANGSCGWNPRYGLRVDGDARVLVNHSYVGCNGYGILAYYGDSTRPSGLVVKWVEAFANGRTSESPDGDGVAAWNGNVTVAYSFLHGNGPSTAGESADAGGGFEAVYPWASNITVYESTISGNAYHGVRLADGAGREGYVNISYTVVSGNGGPGVLLGLEGGRVPGNLTLYRVSIYNNTGLAVDICLTPWDNGDNVTVNDGALNASQPDAGVDYPVITEAYLVAGGGLLYVEGYIGDGGGSPSFAGARVDLYLVNTSGLGDNLEGNAYGSSYYGEALVYLGSVEANATGWFRGFINLSRLPGAARPVNGSLVTAATWLPGNGTSEMGPDPVAAVYRPGNVSAALLLAGTGSGGAWNVTVTLRNGDTRPLIYGQAAVRLPPGVQLACKLPEGMNVSCSTLGAYNVCVFTAPYMPPLSALTASCNATPSGSAWGDARAASIMAVGVDPPGRGEPLLPLAAALALASLGLAALGRRRVAAALLAASLVLLAALAAAAPQFPTLSVYEEYNVSWTGGGYVAGGRGRLSVYNPTPDPVFSFTLLFSENPGLPSNPLQAGALPPGGGASWTYNVTVEPPLSVDVSRRNFSCSGEENFTVTLRAGAPVEEATVYIDLPPGWRAASAEPGLGRVRLGRRVEWSLSGLPAGGGAVLKVYVHTAGAEAPSVSVSVEAVLDWGYACTLMRRAWATGPAAVSVSKEPAGGGFRVSASFKNLASSLVYVLRRVAVYRNDSLVHVYEVNETLPPGGTWRGAAFYDGAGGTPVYYAAASYEAVPAANGSTVPLGALTVCRSHVSLERVFKAQCSAAPPPGGHAPPGQPAPPGPGRGGAGGQQPGGTPSQPGGGRPKPSTPQAPAPEPRPIVYKRGWVVDNHTLGFEIRVYNRGGNGSVSLVDELPPGFAYVSAYPAPRVVEGGRLVWSPTLAANGSFTARVYLSSEWPLCGVYANSARAGGSRVEARVEAPCREAALLSAAAAAALIGGLTVALNGVLAGGRGGGVVADAGGLGELVEAGLLPLLGVVAVPADELARALADPGVGPSVAGLVEAGLVRPAGCRGPGPRCLAELAGRYGAFFVTSSLGAALYCWGRGLRGAYISRRGVSE